MRQAHLSHCTDDKTEAQLLARSSSWQVTEPGMGPGLSPGSLLSLPRADSEKQQEHRAEGT